MVVRGLLKEALLDGESARDLVFAAPVTLAIVARHALLSDQFLGTFIHGIRVSILWKSHPLKELGDALVLLLMGHLLDWLR